MIRRPPARAVDAAWDGDVDAVQVAAVAAAAGAPAGAVAAEPARVDAGTGAAALRAGSSSP